MKDLKKCTRDGNYFTSNNQYGNLGNIDGNVQTKVVKRNTDKGLLPCTRKFSKKLYPEKWKYPKPPPHLPEYKLFKK